MLKNATHTHTHTLAIYVYTTCIVGIYRKDIQKNQIDFHTTFSNVYFFLWRPKIGTLKKFCAASAASSSSISTSSHAHICDFRAFHFQFFVIFVLPSYSGVLFLMMRIRCTKFFINTSLGLFFFCGGVGRGVCQGQGQGQGQSCVVQCSKNAS